MKEKEPFDFERFKQEAMEGLYSGKKAGGTDGVFAPLMKHLFGIDAGSFVYKIEDPDVQAQYNTHDYLAIAQALKWTIKDLLPPDDWSVGDGTKVEKKVLSLSNPEDMRLVVDGLIDYGFFNEPKSLTDTAKHLYIDGKEEETVLKKVLGELEGKLTVEKGKYLKIN